MAAPAATDPLSDALYSAAMIATSRSAGFVLMRRNGGNSEFKAVSADQIYAEARDEWQVLYSIAMPFGLQLVR